MRIPRLYQSQPLISGTTILLSPEAANYLIRVLRLTVNNELRVFNGIDGEFAAVINNITKQQVSIKITEHLLIDNESPIKIHLGQAISRGEKMDLVIQKAVELGVTQITPLITERCGVKLSEERWNKRLQHWQAVIISACEQCGRNILPMINEPCLLTDWLAHFKQDGFTRSGIQLVLTPEGKQKLTTVLSDTADRDITLLIGPEGGLSEIEVQLAKQGGFIDVCLGPRVLRTETAGIAGVTAIQCILGDF